MSATDGQEMFGNLSETEIDLLRQYLEEQDEVIRLKEKLARVNKLNDYVPYEWQKEFHSAGRDNPERMLMAANRVGKTHSGGAEIAYHLTGLYPDWWKGKVFKEPVLCWTGSPTNESSKDIVQNELLGGLGEDLGTGAIPKNLIVGKPSIRQAGVRDVIDNFRVRHVSGGLSSCSMKTYEQGWKKWQGTAPHVVWMDEEPDDIMIFTEAETRILSSGGIVLVTFTPLSGMTRLVEHFMSDKKGVYMKGATWDDAPHLDPEAKAELMERYPDYQRDARTRGIPMLGEGAVFPIKEEMIKVDPFPIPEHFARIKGIDFGIDHPAAGSEIAWDRDQDIIYVIDCYKKAGETAAYHSAWLNKSNKWIPVAWPHDGMNREKAGGNQLHMAYRSHGANLLSKSARYPKAVGDSDEKGGSQPVEPITQELLERMQTGRFKVFTNLSQWFEEFRSYHRKDGRIVDRRDDIMKATMYAVMMKRYARTPPAPRSRKRSTPVLSASL